MIYNNNNLLHWKLIFYYNIIKNNIDLNRIYKLLFIIF